MSEEETQAFRPAADPTPATQQFSAAGDPAQQVNPPSGPTTDRFAAVADPHAEFHQQAAQHFGGIPAPGVPPQPTPMEYPQYPAQPPAPPNAPGYPNVRYPGPTGYPAVPGPQSYPQQPGYPPPVGAPPQPYWAASAPLEGLPFVQKLMVRGARGELIRQPWFQQARGANSDTFVFAGYAGAFLFTLLLNLLLPSAWSSSTGIYTSSIFISMLINALWVGVGYSFLAVGTKLAHQFLAFGICLVGVLISLAGIWSAGVALSVNNTFGTIFGTPLASTGFLVFNMMFSAAMAFLFGFVGFQVFQGIQKFSTPPQY